MSGNIDIEYARLIDYKVATFLRNNKYCLALNKDDTRCKHHIGNFSFNNILCKLHRNHKTKPKYIIVYIDNDHINKDDDDDTDDNNEYNDKLKKTSFFKKYSYHDNSHIFAYPYKHKSKYVTDIELYKQEAKEIANVKYIKLNELKICKVCFEDYANCDLIKCSKITCENKHGICSTCIKGYIESQISSNIGSYECMFNKFDKCRGEYTITAIDTIIDNFYDTEIEKYSEKNAELKTKWIELVKRTDIYKLASLCDDYVICPLCRGWGCIYESNPFEKDKVYIDCHNCKLKWCNICKREAHGDESGCYTLKFKPEENDEQRIQIIDVMIQNIISKALTHNCSTCGCAYIKEEGCNLMYCSHCDGMTCYICNANIYYKEGKGKYWHFAGHEYSDPDATCLTWNNLANDGQENQGNTNYNNKKILKELINLILNNSLMTGEIIYSRIIFLYEKDIEFKFILQKMEEIKKDNFIIIPQDLLI